MGDTRTAESLDLASYLRPGSGVWWSQGAAEPTGLIDALLDQCPSIGRLRAFCGITWNRRLCDELPDEVTLLSYGALGALRRLARRNRLQVVRAHYSALPTMFARGELPNDVALIQVSPPDTDGYVSLGVGIDYAADAILHSSTIIAEINDRMPTVTSGLRLHVDSFAATVETSRELVAMESRESDDIDRRVAQHVAEVVRNGDTIQIGIGSVPSAVLTALSNHVDLGIHSGMITDGVMDLVSSGVVTGARKEIDRGLVVAGTALGTAELYKRVAVPEVCFRPVTYTHSPLILRQLSSLVAINGATEVDLLGRVGSEFAGGRYVGALGGQVDFAGAASRTGARSVFAVRSERAGQSTIVPKLSSDCVTTAREHVDVVVTEHGVAEIRGCDAATVRRRLIAIAAPHHRESLERQGSAER